MPSSQPSLIFEYAKDLFEAFPTLGEDMVARPDGEASLAWFTQLLLTPVPEEAITFGAYLLPRRRAVWWGHRCVVSIIHLLNDQDLRMLQLAEAWVREPGEDLRNRALEEGLAARNKTPGVLIALAAGWSSGSMVDPTQPQLVPGSLTPRAVNAGILSALAEFDNSYRAQVLKSFVDMGVSLATH